MLLLAPICKMGLSRDQKYYRKLRNADFQSAAGYQPAPHWSLAGLTSSRDQLSWEDCLAPEFVDGAVHVLCGEGHVFKTAVERIVLADGGPVDAHGGADGGLDVFGVDVAVSRPAAICRVRARGVGRANGASAIAA